jgi:predicted GNAT family N-acyltransferase
MIYTHKITAERLNFLRKSVGGTEYSERQAKAAIENSYYLVTSEVDGNTVGMARIISDGGYMMHIVDVIVLPHFQGKGIGKELQTRVMNYINQNIQENETVFVSLMAAAGKEEFYEKFGFIKRPSDLWGHGMAQYFTKTDII